MEEIERDLSPYLSRYYVMHNAGLCEDILKTAPALTQKLLTLMIPFLPYLEGKLESAKFSDSADLLCEVIYNLFEIRLPTKLVVSKTTGEESESESTDDASLKTLESQYKELAWLVLVRKYRGLKKRIDYLDSIKRSVRYRDGLPRCFGQIRAVNPQASGRFAGSVYTKKFGLNLYNSPKPNPEFPDFPTVREVFTLEGTGHSFVVCDLQAAHLSISLSHAGQLDVIEDMANSSDGHAGTAVEISKSTGNQFNTLESYYKAKEAKDPEVLKLRMLAKIGIYSVINCASASSIQNSLAETGVFMSLEECKLVIDGLWARIPKVRSLIYATAKEALTSSLSIPQETFTPDTMKDTYPIAWHPVVSSSGRLRFFPSYISKYTQKPQLKAPDVASTLWSTPESSVIINSCARFYHEVQVARPRLKAEINMALYDEISVCCPDEHALEVAKFLHAIITEEWRKNVEHGRALDPDPTHAITKNYSSK
jgi:hypothetical protein